MISKTHRECAENAPPVKANRQLANIYNSIAISILSKNKMLDSNLNGVALISSCAKVKHFMFRNVCAFNGFPVSTDSIVPRGKKSAKNHYKTWSYFFYMNLFSIFLSFFWYHIFHNTILDWCTLMPNWNFIWLTISMINPSSS